MCVLCRGHKGGVLSLQTSGSRVFSCGEDSCIKAWDLEDLVRGCQSTVIAHLREVSQQFALQIVLLFYSIILRLNYI